MARIEDKEILLKNGKTLLIRNGLPKDALASVEFVDKVAAETINLTFGPGDLNLTEESQIKFFNKHLEEENLLALLAFVDGMVVCQMNFTPQSRPRRRHVGEFGISVLKEYWGLGIGKEVLKTLIEWAHQSKVIRKINLFVLTSNQRAINLYKGLGFKEEGMTTRDAQIDGKFYDALLMGLEID